MTIGSKTFVIPFETVRAHALWSEKNFGTSDESGPVGPLRHLSKEAIEASQNPSDIMEFADIAFLFLDSMRRAGHTAEDLAEAMDAKQAILEKRVYRKSGVDQPVEHDRSIPDIA